MNKKIQLMSLSLSTLLFVTGCATKTSELHPKPITKEQLDTYKTYSCNQILSSMSVLENRLQRIAKIQNDKAKSDRALLSWGWILYGIPYLFLDGNGKEKEEFEIFLGQKIALEDLMVQKNCHINRQEVIHNIYNNEKY